MMVPTLPVLACASIGIVRTPQSAPVMIHECRMSHIHGEGRENTGGFIEKVESRLVVPHVTTIPDSLAIAHMIALRFRVAASFKNRLVRTFGQAGSTGDTFIGNQQRHDPRLLLTTIETHTVDKFTPSRPLCVPRRERHSSLPL